MLLLDLMSFEELEEQINIIRKELFNIAAIKGFSDNRVMEISQRLDLYLQRYNELKKLNILPALILRTYISFSQLFINNLFRIFCL